MDKGLIIAPGLDEFMARFAIEKIRPDYIAVLATESTIGYIPSIIKEFKVRQYRTFFIKNIFSTTETIQEFFNAINWIKEIGTVKDIYIEATNCITVIEMSTYITASVLDIFREILGEDIKIHLLYVHATYKIKEDGVFGEVRGTEKLVELEQPIDSLSFVLALDGIVTFNLQRYEQATKTFSTLANNTTGDKSILYCGLALLSLGYEQWDKMNTHSALKSLEDAKINLEKVKYFESILLVIAKIEGNIRAIRDLANNSKTGIILDLYSNALRRMNENRFDDSLARLYACVERITQFQLEKYGIDTKFPDYSKLHADVVSRFKKQIGFLPAELELKKNALLLTLLGDPVGKEIEKIKYKTFLGLVGIRNNSILAHGIKPVTKENFMDFKGKLIEPLLKKFFEINEIASNELENHIHLKLESIYRLLYKKTVYFKV